MSVESQIIDIRASLPSSVVLVAVSKMHPAEAVAEAYAVGQRLFGESRVQELVAKYNLLPKDIEWHMIGHLQTNKVKMIVPFVSMIQSVDSERLVEAIDVEAAKCGRVVDILLEIHVADEATKSGWDYGELLQYLEDGALHRVHNIRVRGVMGIATNSDDESVVRRDFERLAGYKRELQRYFDKHFDTLSMGMSGDYQLAVSCGSTMIRVGSTIFGARDYSK